jgi:signal transduction histidine kinase
VGNFSLLATSTFRLAAAYLLIFALTVGAVLGYVYYNTVVLLERQSDETIRTEVIGIADQYGLLGLQGVAELIKRRGEAERGSIFLLVNPENERIAGNLQNLPPEARSGDGYIDFPLIVQVGTRVENHTGRGYHIGLAGGYRMLVGRDVEEQRVFRELIQRSLFGALGFALIAGLGGGWLTSRNFLQRVDAITTTSRNIMDGDLSQRMPVSGSGDELDRLSRSLNEMLDQISRLMTGMKDVTSNVAHDLKTPLTRLKARVESVLRNGTPDEQRAALSQTIEECDHLLHTFNALLSIARTEAGQAREGMQVIDAREIITEVAELYDPLVEEAGGRLSVMGFDLQPLQVRADRQLLAQALSNLIDNAIKYGRGEKGLEIAILGQSHDGQVNIAVMDAGAGVPAGEEERVKERFVRLDESRSQPGNGLGLALVSAVMKMHGGKLTISNRAPGLRADLDFPPLAANQAG